MPINNTQLREARQARYKRRSDKLMKGKDQQQSGVDAGDVDGDDSSTHTHTSDSSMNTEKAHNLLQEELMVPPPRQESSDTAIPGPLRAKKRVRKGATTPSNPPPPPPSGPNRKDGGKVKGSGSQAFVLLTGALVVSLLTMYFAGRSTSEMLQHHEKVIKIKAEGQHTLAPSEGQHGGVEDRSQFEVAGEHIGAHLATPLNKKRNAIKDITSSGRYVISRISPPLEPEKGSWKSRPSSVLTSTNPSIQFISQESEKAALADDSSPAWCETEMMPFIFENVTTGDWGVEGGGSDEGGPRCRPDRPSRIGNFSSPLDLTLHQRFPLVDVRRELNSVTPLDLQAYWADYPKGLLPKCYSCKGTLVHNILYTLRRWFRIERWFVEEMVSGGNVFVVDQNFLVTFKIANNGVHAEEESPDVQVPIGKITSIHLSPADKRPFLWFMVLTTSLGTRHSVEIKDVALKSFLRTITYVHPKLAAMVVVFDPLGVLSAKHRASGGGGGTGEGSHQKRGDDDGEDEPARVAAVVVKSSGREIPSPQSPSSVGQASSYEEPRNALGAAKLVRTSQSDASVWRGGILEGVLLPSRHESWPYLPCSAFNIQRLVGEARNHNSLGARKEFWPYECSAIRESHCGQEQEISQRRRGLEKVPLRVALALAGFIRSFPRARHVIYENIVKTNRATVFVATWNVIGRVKKTEPVQKKQMLPLDHVFNRVSDWMQLDPTTNRSEFIKILNYKQEFWMLDGNARHGFPHAGLYYCQSKVLELVRQYQPQGHFDVVIRSRMDIFPVSPLYISRLWKHDDIDGGSDRAGIVSRLEQQAVRGELLSLPVEFESRVEYVLNTGASCKLDEVWWPQYATFSKGKLLKSYQDTRYKLFGWQICDWMEIGTAETVLQLEGLFDYAVDNYVFGIAQWIDHAYYIHIRVAYQVVNPFLKIMRHSSSFFG